jgi:hypothetical protein
MGYRVLECGGGAGDGGVDVKVQSPEGRTIVIQCKQHSKAIVGVDVAQELIGAMVVNECGSGVLVVTYHVSKEVKRLTKVLKSVYNGTFDLQVWEGDTLVQLFGQFGQQMMQKREEMAGRRRFQCSPSGAPPACGSIALLHQACAVVVAVPLFSDRR